MLEKIKDTLSEQFDIDRDSIGLDTNFKSLGADSIDLFELVMNIEEEYEVELPTEELSNIETVGDFVEFLKSKGIEE